MNSLKDLNKQLNGGIMMSEEHKLDLVTREGCTVLKVMLLIVDSFNQVKVEQKERRDLLFLPTAAKNHAVELHSKYQRDIITIRDIYREAAAIGRSLYFNQTMGDFNGSTATKN